MNWRADAYRKASELHLQTEVVIETVSNVSLEADQKSPLANNMPSISLIGSLCISDLNCCKF